MAVSEDRIDELFELMLENSTDDGWCHIPDDVTDEEYKELSRRIAIMTMQSRIDGLMEGINTIFEHMEKVKLNLDEYDTMDKIKVRGGLLTIKEDSQGILMDLYSEDKVSDFFKIDLISEDNDESKEEMVKAKEEMEGLIDTEFKESMANIKKYCSAMIEMSDEIIEKMDSNG